MSIHTHKNINIYIHIHPYIHMYIQGLKWGGSTRFGEPGPSDLRCTANRGPPGRTVRKGSQANPKRALGRKKKACRSGSLDWLSLPLRIFSLRRRTGVKNEGLEEKNHWKISAATPPRIFTKNWRPSTKTRGPSEKQGALHKNSEPGPFIFARDGGPSTKTGGPRQNQGALDKNSEPGPFILHFNHWLQL